MNLCSICIAKSRRKFAYRFIYFIALIEKRRSIINHVVFNLNSIEDDDKIERELENVDITAKDKCVIQ